MGIMPRTNVPIEIKRNKSEENTIRQITMEFTGVVEFDTLAVKDIARQMLRLLPLYNPDAIQAPPGFAERSAAVMASDSGTIERMTLAKATTEDRQEIDTSDQGAIRVQPEGMYMG